MASVTLVLRVSARPGCEDALAVGLDAALARLRVHTLASGWTRVRLGPATFGIFETRAPMRTVRGSGTIVPPDALLEGLRHLIDGAPQVAQQSPYITGSVALPRPTRPLSADTLRPLPASLRLF